MIEPDDVSDVEEAEEEVEAEAKVEKEPTKASVSERAPTMLDTLQDDDDPYAKYADDSPELSSASTKSPRSAQSEFEEVEEEEQTFYSESKKRSLKAKDRSRNYDLGLFPKRKTADMSESTFMDPEDYILKPRLSGTAFNIESMELQHSFGYDCVNGNNLCVADRNTLLYHCGHIIHMLNPYTREITYRWSSGKDGISYIAKNPLGPEIAIAEKGNYPDIVCYTWPDFMIVSVLRGGAKRAFACLDFSADGELMVSQSKAPDYLLTIWRWKVQQVYLSVKANNQIVYKTAFSPLDNTILMCCGLNHLKFWKIETTFTGIKIKGSYGKFGPADICDISTFIINKDNKLFSNCPWGNMFFWDGSVVKFEISRKDLQPAHDGLITFFYCDLSQNNVYTAGQDGKIRVWDYEKMISAWPAENGPFEMQPSFERDIVDLEGNVASPVQLVPRVEGENDYHFFLQDKHGGIWNVDLSLNAGASPWIKIMETQAGPVVSVAASPAGFYFATLGADGKLLIYSNDKKRVILKKEFCQNASYMIWLPLELDKSGSVLVIGFSDGTLRVVVASIRAREFNPDDETVEFVSVIQALKPHKKPVTCLVPKANYHSHLLSGSDDETVFLYSVLPFHDHCQICPLGFIKMPGPVTHIELKNSKESFTFLVSTAVGSVSEVNLPDHVLVDISEKDTYDLQIGYESSLFLSVKSCVLRTQAWKAIKAKKEEKLNRKKVELERLKAANPGLNIDEEMFLADDEDYGLLPEVIKPTGDTRINFARYCGENIIWISPDGYDAGFFYEYKIGDHKPLRILDIPGTNREIGIQKCIPIHKGKYLLWGMSDGSIRLVKSHGDPGDFKDYLELSMHSSEHRIAKLDLSYDHTLAFSCGSDGGVFLYTLNLPEGKFKETNRLPNVGNLPKSTIMGYIDPEEPTLEEIKTAEREQNKKLITETIKAEMRAKIGELSDRFEKLLERNEELPESVRLPKEAFLVCKEVDEAIIKKYNDEINDFKKRNEYEALKAKILRNKMYNACVRPIKTFPIYQFGIRIPASVCTFREVKLSQEFLDAEIQTQKVLNDEMRRGRTVATKVTEETKANLLKEKGQREPVKMDDVDWLKVAEKVGQKLYDQGRLTEANLQLLNKLMEARRERNHIQKHYKELDDINEKDAKKKGAVQDPGASVEYKIKLNPEYRIPREHRTTLSQKYWQVLKTRREMYNIKMAFNAQIKKLREDKIKLLRDFQIVKRDVEYISEEIPMDDVVLPRTPNFNTELEFPEKLFMNKPPHCILDDPLPPIPESISEEREKLYGENPNFKEIYEEVHMVDRYVNFTWIPGKMTHDDVVFLSEMFPIHPWRADMILRRHNRFRERINSTVLELLERIEEYDQNVRRLQFERIDCDIKLLNLKIHLYYLIQELNITRGYDVLESSVRARLHFMIKKKHVELLKMNIRKKKMKENNVCIEKSGVVASHITAQFLEIIKDNKYAKHLTRVFKKKYKPPKKKKARFGEDSSSSSSCDEDFDDEDEGDDLEVTIGGAYLFDEKVLPEDCDPEIFQRTFRMRADRHVEEAKISEARFKNQIYVKEIEVIRKTLLLVETILAIYYLQLDSFLKLKQQAYNKIFRVVRLKPSQVQHFDETAGDFPCLNRCILIKAETIQKLLAKAQMLEKEVNSFKRTKYKCKDHVQRLRRDIDFMTQQVSELQTNKKLEMMRKFGTEVDMERLEKVVAFWILKDAEQNSIVTHRSMAAKIAQKEADLKEKRRKLMEMRKEETNQYHELFSIQEERNKITSQLINMKQQDPTREPLDLKKILRDMEKELICQIAYKEYLLNQISLLKFKQEPRLLDKDKKKKEKKKEDIGSVSTEADMRNILLDVVKRALPSNAEFPWEGEEGEEEEETDGESTLEDGSEPSKLASEIIEDVIHGALPSQIFPSEYEGEGDFEYVMAKGSESTDSQWIPDPPPQSLQESEEETKLEDSKKFEEESEINEEEQATLEVADETEEKMKEAEETEENMEETEETLEKMEEAEETEEKVEEAEETEEQIEETEEHGEIEAEEEEEEEEDQEDLLTMIETQMSEEEET